MFACEETWDIFLTFGQKKRHVRTFKLMLTDSSQAQQPTETLWLRLPRNASLVEYKLNGANCPEPIEDGLDRGISICFDNPEVCVHVSFETLEDPTECSSVINFRYPIPKKPSWKTYLGEHSLKLVFHLPLGLPPNLTKWVHRLGFISLVFRRKNWISSVTSRPPHFVQVFLRIFKEYYSLPWGYEFEYGTNTKEGKLDSLFITPRRIIYEEGQTEWIRKGSAPLGPYIGIRPRPIIEALVIAAIIGLLMKHFLPLFPVWLMIILLCLLLPIFSRGLIWKLIHLFR